MCMSNCHCETTAAWHKHTYCDPIGLVVLCCLNLNTVKGSEEHSGAAVKGSEEHEWCRS